MGNKYTFEKYDKELMARAVGRNVSISTKQSIEICARIRNKNVASAKRMLEDAIAMKRAIRYTRFNGDVGHKPGLGPGRYPIKTATQILEIIKSAEANAQFKGLNTANLHIVHSSAQKAARPMHYGRQRGTSMKRTHIEIVVQEKVQKEKPKKAKPKAPKQEKKEVKPTPKAEAKPAPKVEAKPQVEQKAEVKKEEVKQQAPAKETPKEAPKVEAPVEKKEVAQSQEKKQEE